MGRRFDFKSKGRHTDTFLWQEKGNRKMKGGKEGKGKERETFRMK